MLQNKSNFIRLVNGAAVLLGLGFGLFFSPSTLASCQATISQIEQKTNNNSYDVFSDTPIALDVQFKAEIKTGCPVNLVVFPADKTSEIAKSTKQKLDFTLYAQGAYTQNEKLILPTSVQNSELDFSVRFASRQYSEAGNMSKEMIAQLWDSETQSLIAEKKFSLDVEVKSSSAVFFSGMKQRNLHIALGELYTGKRVSGLPQLRVISTSPYEIGFSSKNLGKLKHTTDENEAIDYHFSVGKKRMPLGKAEQKWYSAKMTAYTGELIPLSLSIGNTDDKIAGEYKDVLNISIKPSLLL